MAISIGNTSNGTTTSSNSITWLHNNDKDFLVVTTASFDGSGGTDICSGVTYDGDALTKAKGNYDDGGGGRAEATIWYLASPSSGSNNVVATWSGTSNIQAGAVSLGGINKTDIVDATQSATAGTGTPTLSITTN